MGKGSKVNSKKKLGKGMRYNSNGTIEGYGTIHNKRGDSLKYSFTRDTEEEILDMKARIRLLGAVDNDVEKIKIGRHTDDIELVRKRTSKKKRNIEFE